MNLGKEKIDFYRSIDKLEENILDVNSEITKKLNFLIKSKEHFIKFNHMSQNLFFKNDFYFYLDLLIGKVVNLEFKFTKLTKYVILIKENYKILTDFNFKTKNKNLSETLKALIIIATFFYVFAFVPVIFGMNIPVPFLDVDNYWPFFSSVFVTLGLAIAQLIIFRRLRWF